MRGRRALTAAALATAAGGLARRGLRKPRVVAYPPGPDAITDDIAKDVAIELAALARVGRDDRVLSFAPSVATSVEPYLHGRRYFPPMLAAIESATSSVHLLIYGFQPGEIGTTFRDALIARAAAGVEVRLAVDAIGSQIDFNSKACTPSSSRPGSRWWRTMASCPTGTGPWARGTSTGTWTTSSTSSTARC